MKKHIIRLFNRSKVLFNMLLIKSLRKKPFPFYVNLVINSRCNLKCSYCFGEYSHRNSDDMTFERFIELIDTLRKNKLCYVLIQGGEPLLHPDLGKMIQYLYDNNIVCAIVSNGQFPEKLKDIPQIDLMDNICFSLDGNRDGNDKVRGTGCFDKVVESIQEVKKLYSVPVRICSTIHKYVVNDVDFLAEFMKKNNIEWNINFLFKGDERLEKNSLELTRKELMVYTSKLLQYKKCKYPVFLSSKILKYILNWPGPYKQRYLSKSDIEKRSFSKVIECQYGKYEIVIDEDEKVYPCQAMQGVFTALSIKEHGFEKAFSKLRFKPCYTCYIPSLLNTSAMINWDCSVILETILHSLRNYIF